MTGLCAVSFFFFLENTSFSVNDTVVLGTEGWVFAFYSDTNDILWNFGNSKFGIMEFNGK